MQIRGTTVVCLALCVPLHVVDAAASWQGPTVLFSAGYGSGPNQIGYARGDTDAYDTFPREILVASDGSLVLSDPVNRRILVLRADGSRRASFGPVGLPEAVASQWPAGAPLVTPTSILVKAGDALQRFDFDGNLLQSATTLPGALVGLDASERPVLRQSGVVTTWVTLKTDLSVDSTTTVVPLLPGAVTATERARFEVDPVTGDAVLHSDIEVQAAGRAIVLRDLDGSFTNVVSSPQGGLYAATIGLDPQHFFEVEFQGWQRRKIEQPHDVVLEFDAAGNQIGRVDFPPDEYPSGQMLDGVNRLELQATAIVGGTAIDRSGNVYRFHRGDTAYRILKWTHLSARQKQSTSALEKRPTPR